MKTLGTILPNYKTMAIADAHADRLAKANEKKGDHALKHCEKRFVGGEFRWYDTTDQYAIVTRCGKIIWFQVCEDGDRRITR